MQTLPEFHASKSGPRCYIAKKGKRYITIQCGELRLSPDQSKAIAAKTEKGMQDFISNAVIDTRNAKVMGKSYQTVEICF